MAKILYDSMSWENLTYQWDYFDLIYENLYPEDISRRRAVMNDGRVITKSEDTDEYNWFDYYQDHFQGNYFDEITHPHLVIASVGTIFAIEKLIYDQITIEYLNQKGLHIYMWDNLFMSFGDPKVLSIDGHGDHLPKEQRASGNDVALNFILTEENKKRIYSFELESIKKFVKNNKLSNVTAYTNEYETAPIFQAIYPEFKIRAMNIFIMTYRRTIGGLNSDHEKLLDVDKIDKKFISLSLRYEVHRHIITAYIINRNTELSWNNDSQEWDKVEKPDLNYLGSILPFEFLTWKDRYPDIWKKIESGNETLIKSTPIRLGSEQNIEKFECGALVPFPVDSHARSFCQIVTESTFCQPFPCFSEKVINAMVCMRPFIMVSTPNSLKYLKKLGFKTFDRWWDESYDQEEDHEKRIIKILRLIDYIDSFSIEELKSMYISMKEVLHHNLYHSDIIRTKSLVI
jgi:hypothetical protein